MISEEEFLDLALGDVVQVSPLYEMGSPDWSGKIRGPGEWTVISHMANTAVLEFDGQDKQLTRDLEGRCVVHKKYLDKVISKSGNKPPVPQPFGLVDVDRASLGKLSQQQRDNIIRNMITAGRTYKQIAERAGISEAGVFKRAKYLGLTKSKPHRTPEQLAELRVEIVAKREAGMKVRDLLKEMGISSITYKKAMAQV